MKKAIWSKTWLNADDDAYAVAFNECIGDLLAAEEVKELERFSQHLNTSRLQHSLNVAYYSFVVCKKMGLDYRSAARAGILHDLFLYDWRTQRQPEGRHPVAHPIVALRNARKITEINDIEADAIVRHMWPLTPIPPKYMESYVICMVDKYCAMAEMTDQTINTVLERSMILRSMVAGGVYAR